MKKFLTLILIALAMASCGDSGSSYDDGGGDNGENDDGGKGGTTLLGKTKNPIPQSEWAGAFDYMNTACPLQGDWILTKENGKPTSRYFAIQIDNYSWYTALKQPNKGNTPYYTGQVLYEFNNKQLREEKSGIIYTYTTSTYLETMTLFDGTNTCEFKKYDNNGIFKMGSDWNNKLSPYYAVYGGKYNPVEGKWEVYSHGNELRYPSNWIYWFDEDHSLYWIQKGTTRYKTKYIITNTGMQGLTYSIVFEGRIVKYWIDKDTLFLQEAGNPFDMDMNKIWKLLKVNE